MHASTAIERSVIAVRGQSSRPSQRRWSDRGASRRADEFVRMPESSSCVDTQRIADVVLILEMARRRSATPRVPVPDPSPVGIDFLIEECGHFPLRSDPLHTLRPPNAPGILPSHSTPESFMGTFGSRPRVTARVMSAARFSWSSSINRSFLVPPTHRSPPSRGREKRRWRVVRALEALEHGCYRLARG